MTADEPPVVAVDWGGTWIRTAVVRGGRIGHRERVPRPAELAGQYRTVAELVGRAAATAEDVAAVGIGVAGVVQRGLVVTAANLGITSTTDVLGALADHVPGPAFLVNDVQATALGLAARWPEDVTAVITMGTGIGGAVIDRGRLLVGNGGAGDFGHIVVDASGPVCVCGGIGCLEQAASGRVFAAAAAELAAAGSTDFWATLRAAGRPLHAGDLQDAARASDPDADVILQGAARTFAGGVRTVVAALDPARIVLAGPLLGDSALFGQLVRQRWDVIRPAWCRTPLVHVADDEDAALIGAASFAASST